nr:L-sorbose 1-phosphate reductase [Bacteroidales bacterium]
TKNLPHLPGGKKLIYTGIDLELTALADFEEKALNNPLFRTLAEITKTNNNLWSVEAEEFLLKHF